MAKPSTLFRWATNALATLAPSSGRQDTGWAVDEMPPARVLNWLLNGSYQWQQYLDNLHGEVQFLNKAYTWTAAHVFGTTVGITGNTTIGGDATVSGTVKALAGALVGSNLGLYAAAEGVYTDNAGVLSPRTRTIRRSWSAAAQGNPIAQPQSAGAIEGDGILSLETDPANSSNFAQASFPVVLPQGAVLTGWRVLALVDPGSLGSVSFQCGLKKVTHDFTTPGLGTLAFVGSNQTSSGSGSVLRVVGQSGLSETVDALEQMHIFASITSSAGYHQTVSLHSVELTYTETRASGSH